MQTKIYAIMYLEAIYTILWLFACIACITVYCVGFRAITAENKLLYFLREGFDNIEGDEHDRRDKKVKKLVAIMLIQCDKLEKQYNVNGDCGSGGCCAPSKKKFKELSQYQQDKYYKLVDVIQANHMEAIEYIEDLTAKRINQRKWLLNPIVACCTCFASFWGSIIFWGLNLLTFDFHWKMIPAWVFCCVSASFFNWLLWDKIDK